MCLLVTGLVHIRQSDRVMVGLNGNLYFANLLKSDSREDYICNSHYIEARTILPDTAIALTVLPSECTHMDCTCIDLWWNKILTSANTYHILPCSVS